MADWNLDLTLVSASNLVDVRELGYLRVYAEVSINEVEALKYTSPVDWEGQTNPVWNFKTPYNITNKLIEGDEFKLVINLYCERTFLDDKFVGRLTIPLKTLFQSRNVNGGFGDFEVERVDENGGFGVVKLWYRFVEIVQTTKNSAPTSSAVQEEQTSLVSGLLQEAASFLLHEIGMGLVESIIPGASVIFELIKEE